MDTKLSTLQRNIAESKKREEQLKKRVSIWRGRALKERAMLKSAVLQYERIIREYKKMVEDFKNSVWKLLFITLHEKYRNWRDGRRRV